MGCRHSNTHRPLRERKSCLCTNESENNDDVRKCDALTMKAVSFPLTEDDVVLVLNSWTQVKCNMTCAGMTMFLRMFQERSEVRKSFSQFRSSVSSKELWEDRKLEHHGMLVMGVIDEIMINLDDVPAIKSLILEQGRAHAHHGHLRVEYFWAIEQPFLEAVRETFEEEEHYIQLETTYRKIIRFIIGLFVVGFKEARCSLESGSEVTAPGSDNSKVALSASKYVDYDWSSSDVSI